MNKPKYTLNPKKIPLGTLRYKLELRMTGILPQDELVTHTANFCELCKDQFPDESGQALKSLTPLVEFFMEQTDCSIEHKHFVYFVTVDNIIKYVGSGKGDRWKHTLGGKSTCGELNRDVFSNKKVACYLLGYSLPEKFARDVEGRFIQILKEYGFDLYNKRVTSKEFPDGIDFYVKTSHLRWACLGRVNDDEMVDNRENPLEYIELPLSLLLSIKVQTDKAIRDFISKHGESAWESLAF